MRVDVSDVFSVHVGPESLIAKECVSCLRIGKEPHLCLVPSLATTHHAETLLPQMFVLLSKHE